MIGKPKFKRGDKVKFTYDGKVLTGTVYVVDAYGTLGQNEEVSYDVVSDEEKPCLYKHITEPLVTKP